MSTFYIYSSESSQFLGELSATDTDAAQTLASAIWSVPLTVSTEPPKRVLRKVA